MEMVLRGGEGGELAPHAVEVGCYTGEQGERLRRLGYELAPPSSTRQPATRAAMSSAASSGR
jgi:hypothetical protein